MNPLTQLPLNQSRLLTQPKAVRADPATTDKIVASAFRRFLTTLSERSIKNDGWRPTASAYIPSTFAEVFGVDDRSFLIDLTEAHICMDYFSHAVDDLTDDPGHKDIASIHVPQLMLARSLRLYCALSGNSEKFIAEWERLMTEASAGERFLLKHKSVCGFEEIDFRMMAQKSALSKVSLTVMALKSDKSHILRVAESLLDDAFVAIQLADDLMDLAEDVSQGMYTYPLVLASHKGASCSQLDGNTLPYEVLLKTLSRILHHLECARESCFTIRAASMIELLTELAAAVRSVERESFGLCDLRGLVDFAGLKELLIKRIHPRMAH